MLSQIHINVTEKFWKSLFDGTSLWKNRSDSYICRFALHELYVETFAEKAVLNKRFRRKPETGPRHLQVKALSADEQALWDALVPLYGSRASALAVALQALHDSLNYEEPEADITSDEVARWRKQRSVSSSGSGR